MNYFLKIYIFGLLLIGSSLLNVVKAAQSDQATEVSVAVAANFAAPAQKIAAAFDQDTGYKALLAVGSTGKFYTQIKNGAPFQILLSADQETPQRLEQEGLIVAGTRFTYSIGKLVLWSKQIELVDERGEILKKGNFEHIAIADPKLAPYGLAAMQTISKLGLDKQILSKAVWGENISQTFLYVDSEAASLGFVALSQVFKDGHITQGSAWIVPTSMYANIKQDAVLLKTGKNVPAAELFMKYLKSKKALEIIKSYGYSF